MAELIGERDMEKDFRISDGRIITLKLAEDFSEVSFWEDRSQLGIPHSDVFIFDFLEDLSEPTYRLTRMFCPVKGEGLGTEAIKLFIEYTDAKIVTRPPHTGELSDGSNLTNDALWFVPKMQEKGLIEEWDLD